MRVFPFRLRRALFVCASACLLALAHGAARAQSGDLGYPTPIFSNEITGRIAPRDIGDPRHTRHYYIFRGTEGDISVTLESAELSGDVDLFTAGTLRPLLKLTIYGGPTAATKSVYLRREETLVLRVQARAAGEAEGTYRIRLGGSFAPAPAGLAEAPAPAVPEASASEPGTRRVTATGARIDEPAPPAAEASAEPTPTPAEGERAEESAPAARREAPRSGRRARGAANRRRGRAEPAAPAEPAREGETTERSAEAAETTPPAEARPEETTPAPATTRTRRPSPRRNRARPPRRTTPRESAEQPEDAAPAATPEAPGRRLVIVTKDGETLERDMRTVRRVTIENNQIVVVTRDGKVIRHPLSNVARMAIEQ